MPQRHSLHKHSNCCGGAVVTWLDRGKWDGLLIPTCHSGTTIIRMIPADVCKKGRTKKASGGDKNVLQS